MTSSKKILLTFWTFTLLLFRPSFIGEQFNQLIFVLFLTLSLLIWFIGLKTSKGKVDKDLFFVYSIVIITIVYFLVQGLLLSESRLTVINSTFLLLGVTTCFLLVLRHENIYFIFQKFILIHYFFAISSIITFTFFILNGFEITEIPVLAELNEFMGRPKIERTYYSAEDLFSDTHHLFLPFTVSWANSGVFGIAFPRLTGIYREAGMAQIFFVTAYLLTYFVEIKNLKRKRWVILVGAFLTFSTAGLFSLLGGILVYRFINREMLQKLREIIRKNAIKFFVLGFVLIIGIYTVLTLPDIGVLAKLSSESGKERFKSFALSWNAFKENPIFGIGYYGDFKENENGEIISNQSLGILGPLYQVGLIGIFLYLACWYYGVTKLGNRDSLSIYLPCFITLFLSQPSYNDVIVWFLILANTQYVGIEE